MKVFIKDKDYESASRLYNDNQELFLTAREKRRRAKQLQELADHLNNSLAPQIDSLQNSNASLRFDPLDPSNWDTVAFTMSLTQDLLNEYHDHSILQESEYRLPAVDTLAAQLEFEQDQIYSQGETAFLAYDHFHGDSFF